MTHSVRLSGLVPGLLALCFLTGCATLGAPWLAPEVALIGVQPRLLSADRQAFLVNLSVNNPNDRALPIKGLSYRVLLEGQPLAEGSSRLARIIQPGDTQQVDLEVSSNLLALMPELPRWLLSGESLTWTVSGIAEVDAAGLPLPLPFRYSGEIAPAALLAGLLR